MSGKRETPATRLIFGIQPVREALRVQGVNLGRLLLEPESKRTLSLRELATTQGVVVETTSRGELDRLCKGGLHQGAAAYARPLKPMSFERVLEEHDLALLLDGIQDPQNFGAVVRSAVGLGRTPVVWPEHAAAPLSPATFRASAGAIEHAALCRVASLRQAVQEADAAGFHVVGLDAHAPGPLHELDLCGPTLIVLGSEGTGLSRSIKRSCHVLARLVAPHTIDSLNASVAAALALYEARSQRDRAAGLVEKSAATPGATG